MLLGGFFSEALSGLVGHEFLHGHAVITDAEQKKTTVHVNLKDGYDYLVTIERYTPDITTDPPATSPVS